MSPIQPEGVFGGAPSEERSDAREAWREEAAETLAALGDCIGFMAQAMREDDAILGALSGEGVANHCAALPKHIRDVFVEHLSDEAAAGAKADRLYWEAMERGAQGEARAPQSKPGDVS